MDVFEIAKIFEERDWYQQKGEAKILKCANFKPFGCIVSISYF